MKPTMVLAGSLRTDPVCHRQKGSLQSWFGKRGETSHDLTKFELSPWDVAGAPSVNPTTKTIAFTVN
jgi:hypothetical protein